jgi:TolB protein
VQWAPTGKSLAFLAPKGLALTLSLAANADGEKPAEVTQGSSINLTWGRKGDVLFLNHGEALAVVDTTLPIRPAPLGPQSSLGGVPVQSPHSYDIAYLDATLQGEALFVGDAAAIDAGTSQQVLPVQGQAAFLWSPTREVLAVATSPNPDTFEHTGLSIVDPRGADSRQLVDETVLAFFWSPDGSRLAYFTPAEEQGSARLKVVPAAGGAVQTVATFSPTQDMAVYLSFFDQFAHSHSIWSPDSRRLVIALREEGGASSIQVLDAGGTEAPRTVAQGNLAFWSPR